MRSAMNSNAEMFQAFPYGGTIHVLTINDATWTEFDPDGCDLVLMQTPPISGGRVVTTNTATFTDLEDGMAVTPLHLQRSVDVYPGQDVICVDRDDRKRAVKFFYAVADLPDTSIDLVYMMAAD